MAQSIHEFHDDPRNADILIWVNGALKRRDEAVVSVFDSGFVLGDGVWEGLRVTGGHPAFLDAHLEPFRGTWRRTSGWASRSGRGCSGGRARSAVQSDSAVACPTPDTSLITRLK